MADEPSEPNVKMRAPSDLQADGTVIKSDTRSDTTSEPAYRSSPQPFRLRWPTGEVRLITQQFGANSDIYTRFGLPGHDGIDFRMKVGEPVYAAADGEIQHVGWLGTSHPHGYSVRIRHILDGTEYETIYAHLQEDSAQIKPSDMVSAGQLIARSGMSGNATGPHLHFALKHIGARNGGFGDFVDPTPYLDPLPAATDTLGLSEDERPQPDVAKIGSAFALNDRPRGDDRLGFKDYAEAFAAVLRNPATRPPLTIGIYAAWGMGKSFLMQLIREALERDQPPDAPEFILVDFNAWVYSGSDNLWAGLVSRIYERVEKRLGTKTITGFRLSKKERRRFQLLPLRVILSAVPAAVLVLISNWDQLSRLWSDVLGVTSVIALIVGLVSAFRITYDLVSKTFVERAQQFRQMAERPDFRDKIGFMADVKAEIDFVVDLLQQQSQGKQTRLVIFIDDLDRCPPAKAVEVLEAIMLLLSEDRAGDDAAGASPFYVFLGLDARVLVKAVEERYGKVLVEAGISGYEYLDKIVQIPFTIPATDETGIKNYIHALLPRPNEASDRALIRQILESPGRTPRTDRDAAPVPAGKDATTDTAPPAESGPAQPPTPPTETRDETDRRQEAPPVEEVAFTPDELTALDDFAPYLSRNPRRAKRIVNIYRLVRILDKHSRAGLDPVRSRKLIKWVMLNEQWPYRMGLIIAQRQNAEQTRAGPGAQDADTLGAIFDEVEDKLHGDEGKRLLHLDDDPEVFGNFISRESTLITAADIRAFEPLTFNLNPAIGGEVRTMLAKAYTMPQPQTGSASSSGDGKPAPDSDPAKDNAAAA